MPFAQERKRTASVESLRDSVPAGPPGSRPLDGTRGHETLPPTAPIVCGNPHAGRPLMPRYSPAAVELPLDPVVRQDAARMPAPDRGAGQAHAAPPAAA
ncbi:hypothetical protein [Burkholderia glumae]|uniref:hypothetical protein n=1 Tax=Burkholderia glumae TaxID=337 RepID=UPI000CB5F53F|nr:hypothetical protein [Burkholderia glumae]NVE20978.1 hypothetical protein [Burkholderia glumae]PJO24382.1 hypothetical protein Y5A_004445 [Burkholderia glumae AU6208]UVS96488.1 hypothetical protein EFP19_12510 [Burkholderia glumae]